MRVVKLWNAQKSATWQHLYTALWYESCKNYILSILLKLNCKENKFASSPCNNERGTFCCYGFSLSSLRLSKYFANISSWHSCFTCFNVVIYLVIWQYMSWIQYPDVENLVTMSLQNYHRESTIAVGDRVLSINDTSMDHVRSVQVLKSYLFVVLVFRIRIHLMRIRIQHFKAMWIQIRAN